jgi:CRISPR-associated endonuclease Cas2
MSHDGRVDVADRSNAGVEGAPLQGMLFTHEQFRAARCAHRVMVAYDTPSNRRRRKLARSITAYAPRIQQSVYQGDLTATELRLMIKTIECLADADEDRLVVTPLCVRCAAAQTWVGPAHDDARIVGARLDWEQLSDPARLVIA